MYKALMIIVIMFVVVSSVEAAYPCSDLPYIIGEEQYDKLCPYGDAIIINKNEKEALGKIVGIGTDCVYYKSGMWETRDYTDEGKWIIKRYDPNQFEIWTMDGQLISNIRGDVIVESSEITMK